MNRVYNLLVVLWLSIPISFAQKAPIWGEILQEDLRMTHCAWDTTARAVVLADYGHLTFNFLAQDGEPRFEMEIHRRIKILHQSAFDEGDISILFYSEKKYEEVKNLKAQLFTPDGRRFQVDKKDIFVEKIQDKLSLKKFTFPNLVEGAVLEYKYTLSSKNLVTLEDWYFQENIPVRWSELVMEVPSFYKYIFLSQGRAMDISEQDNYSTSITIPKYAYSSVSEKYERRGSQITETTLNTYRFVQKEVPALKEEAYITTMEDYIAKIKFQLNTTALPNAPVRSFLTNWSDVAKRLMKEEFFGQQFTKRAKYKKLWAAAEPHIQEGKTAMDKIVLAYDFLNKHMEWNKQYTYSVTENTLDICFEKKKATSGELNVMLLALLQEVGINAKPVLISTRSHGKVQPLYPILDQFNHTMVLVTIEEQNILLDVGNPFRPIGYPRVNALNYQAWVVNKNQSEWINLAAPKSVEKMLMNFKLDQEGSFEGTIAIGKEGYEAVDGVTSFHGATGTKHFKEVWTELFPDIVIEQVEFDHTKINKSSFKINMVCKIPDQAQVMNDFIYFSPSIYNSFEENPFKLEKRVYPVEIPYPFSEQFVLNVDLPEGYIVEELPESAKVVLPNKGGSFLYMVKQNGQRLQIIRKIKINQLQFNTEEYTDIKTFFDLIIEKSEEQVVLKKQQP
ncbi:MAG: DUF3857 domain-containing protein [Aureispira sp.]